jgi:hypothetical protein
MVEPSLTWTCWGSLMRANQFLQSREENWVHHEAYKSINNNMNVGIFLKMSIQKIQIR